LVMPSSYTSLAIMLTGIREGIERANEGLQIVVTNRAVLESEKELKEGWWYCLLYCTVYCWNPRRN
jgi:hypothetical protein